MISKIIVLKRKKKELNLNNVASIKTSNDSSKNLKIIYTEVLH